MARNLAVPRENGVIIARRIIWEWTHCQKNAHVLFLDKRLEVEVKAQKEFRVDFENMDKSRGDYKILP